LQLNEIDPTFELDKFILLFLALKLTDSLDIIFAFFRLKGYNFIEFYFFRDRNVDLVDINYD